DPVGGALLDWRQPGCRFFGTADAQKPPSPPDSPPLLCLEPLRPCTSFLRPSCVPARLAVHSLSHLNPHTRFRPHLFAAGFDRSARVASPLFRRKNIDQLISDCEGAEFRLKKSLGWLSLTSLGIGAVIGSGIFTIVGTAIAGQKFVTSSILNAPLLDYLVHHSASFGRPGAAPAIALSFVLVAIACGFASVCYAELAAMIPIAGSAYTYTYA